jgi:hypothetical protein
MFERVQTRSTVQFSGRSSTGFLTTLFFSEEIDPTERSAYDVNFWRALLPPEDGGIPDESFQAVIFHQEILSLFRKLKKLRIYSNV